MSEEMAIEVKALTMRYGSYVLMEKLSFVVPAAKVMVVMGGSGCGKSTLLKYLVGLKNPAPNEGEIAYFGEPFPTDEEARGPLLRNLGVLYQAGALWSSMTLAENVALPLEQYTKLSKADIAEVCALKLALVGLKGFGDFYPSEISGGMRKRAGLARAMALDPKLLFFDEPSAGLDPISARHLDDLILSLRDNLGTTIVVITHELASIFAIADSSIFLDPKTKSILAEGNPNDLLKDGPEEVQTFLRRGEPANESAQPAAAAR